MTARIYLVDPDREEVGTRCPPFCTSAAPTQGTENQLQHDENTEVIEHSVLGPFTL